MMSSPVAGIDPHQSNFTVAVVDANGVEITHASFVNGGAGYLEAIELLSSHGVGQVGVEGSASWGSHVAIALVAAGFDAREVPPQRAAQQRRARRLAKTDTVDAVATARALLAEPSLGPVQALEVYDALVAKIEAVLEHRRMLVRSARWACITSLTSSPSSRPRSVTASEPTARSRLAWCASAGWALSRRQRRQRPAPTGCHGCWRQSNRTAWRWPRSAGWNAELVGLLDEHGTTLRDEPGIGPIAAATLVVEVGDPFRFASESKFARWCGTGAVALSSGEGNGYADPASPRLRRQPSDQQRALHRQRHPATLHRRRPHLPRPQDQRGQNPASGPPSPQTTPRQPSHPTHVERRITTTRTIPLTTAA